MRSDFIVALSRELRAPLTAMRGALSLLANGVVGPMSASALKYVDEAARGSDRLEQLIADVLEIERLEGDRMRFDRRAVLLDPLVAQAVDHHRAYAEQFDVQLQFSARAQGEMVHADPARLVQVLANLLSNAAENATPGSTVWTSTSCDDGRVRVGVRDTGHGIPEELRPRVFERFAHVDSSDGRRRGRTGLGLSISRAIIERLDGEIGFETETGVGTEFYFCLPVLPLPREGTPQRTPSAQLMAVG